MTVLARGIGLAMGLLALGLAGPAAAQENLDQGKTPAQLFASDCAICHKSPQGLAARGGLFGLEDFLREHYTASRESAAAIASYLRAVGSPPTAAGRTAKGKKGEGKAKGAEKKPSGKTGETKAGEPKTSESKPADAKPADSKPAESKAAEPKPAKSKPAESKPADAKSAEPKPAEGGKSE